MVKASILLDIVTIVNCGNMWLGSLAGLLPYGNANGK